MKILKIALLLLFVGLTSAFMPHGGLEVRAHGRSNMNMLFGGTKKKVASSVTIKVDGKTITSDTVPFNLRKVMQANKIDVYPLKAKITGNCGGAGICGTCAVRVTSGMNNLNPPSKNEQNTLKGKKPDIRLSCCARVSGPIECKAKAW
jgi:ferredoxin